MQKFKKLLVWKKALILISNVYKFTLHYPKYEFYGLVDQLRRAAVSIALNIAEGSGAGTDKEFGRFLYISLRSIYEVISGIEIAKMLNYGISSENDLIIQQTDELGAMIHGLIKSLKKADS